MFCLGEQHPAAPGFPFLQGKLSRTGVFLVRWDFFFFLNIDGNWSFSPPFGDGNFGGELRTRSSQLTVLGNDPRNVNAQKAQF